MTESSSTQPGSPTWADLATSDQAKSLAFYSALFGWTHDEPQEQFGGYANFAREGGQIAGCVPAMPGMPDAWTVYFSTDDADKSCELTAGHGGAVHAPAMDVMGLGSMAVLGDPGGAAFGVWKAGTHTGFSVIDEPDSPSWFELHTTAYDEVVPFYRDVLGIETVTVSDVPGFRYTTLNHGDHQLAGIMDGSQFMQPGQSSWKVYFNTTDVDASVAAAVGLGAAVTEAAIDTPYGRMAALTDTTGAIFKLRQP